MIGSHGFTGGTGRSMTIDIRIALCSLAPGAPAPVFPRPISRKRAHMPAAYTEGKVEVLAGSCREVASFSVSMQNPVRLKFG